MLSLLNQIELEVITLCSYLSSINSCLNYGTRHRDLKPRDLEPRDLRHVSSDLASTDLTFQQHLACLAANNMEIDFMLDL